MLNYITSDPHGMEILASSTIVPPYQRYHIGDSLVRDLTDSLTAQTYLGFASRVFIGFW